MWHKLNSKQLELGLNSEFSFSLTGCLTKAKGPWSPIYQYQWGGNDEFMSFPRTLASSKQPCSELLLKLPIPFLTKICLLLSLLAIHCIWWWWCPAVFFPPDFSIFGQVLPIVKRHIHDLQVYSDHVLMPVFCSTFFTWSILAVCCPEVCSSGQTILRCIGWVYHLCREFRFLQDEFIWDILPHLVFCTSDASYRWEVFGHVICTLSKFLHCTGRLKEL